MGLIETLLNEAIRTARKRSTERHFLVGASALRADGAIVTSRNERSMVPSPEAHAEARVLRKSGSNAEIVVVARVLRTDELGLAKPCPDCAMKLRARGVKRVLYTTPSGVEELKL